MDKIAVIGSSGSGKSYLANGLGERLSLPVIELDDIILDENYTKTPLEIYRSKVLVEASKNRWIIEGVYPKVSDIVWTSADVVIWLSLPFEAIRERYEERESNRDRSGPFPDIDIHKKEYMKLTNLYPEIMEQLSINRVVKITDPEYTLDDVLSKLSK